TPPSYGINYPKRWTTSVGQDQIYGLATQRCGDGQHGGRSERAKNDHVALNAYELQISEASQRGEVVTAILIFLYDTEIYTKSIFIR
ncbi:hypothetical protein, partial [Thioclava kandeliae]